MRGVGEKPWAYPGAPSAYSMHRHNEAQAVCRAPQINFLSGSNGGQNQRGCSEPCHTGPEGLTFYVPTRPTQTSKGTPLCLEIHNAICSGIRWANRPRRNQRKPNRPDRYNSPPRRKDLTQWCGNLKPFEHPALSRDTSALAQAAFALDALSLRPCSADAS